MQQKKQKGGSREIPCPTTQGTSERGVRGLTDADDIAEEAAGELQTLLFAALGGAANRPADGARHSQWELAQSSYDYFKYKLVYLRSVGVTS